MKKLFTKELVQALGVIVLAAVIGFGISIASADWTAPLAAAPTCATGNPGCDAPINTSSLMQTKGTGAMVANFIDTSLSRAITNLGGMSSIGNADFQGGIFNFGTKGVSNAQGQGNYGVESDFYAPVSLYSDAFADPLTIDLSANTTGSQSTDAIMLKGSSSSSVNHINIITDKPLLNFFDDNAADHSVNQNTGDTSIGAHNGYFSGNLQIKGDNNAAPSNGQVLTSTDASGDSTWGTLAVSGGFPAANQFVTLGRYYDNNGSDEVQNAWIYCPSGYIAMTGGGDCEGNQIAISQPIYSSSNSGNAQSFAEGPGWSDQSSSNDSSSYYPGTDKVETDQAPNGWELACNQGTSSHLDLHIVVSCMAASPTTISVAPNTAVVVNNNNNNNNNNPPTPTWHYAPAPANATASSCAAAWQGTEPGVTFTSSTVGYIVTTGTPMTGHTGFWNPAPPNATIVAGSASPTPTGTGRCAISDTQTNSLTAISPGNYAWKADTGSVVYGGAEYRAMTVLKY